MISTHCVEKLTHCKAVSSPLNDSLSISHLTSEKNCISLIDSLVFGHLNIVLCLEGRPILLVVFRMHEFWKRRGEICKTKKKTLFLLTCSWHQKHKTTNSRIHEFKVLQRGQITFWNPFLMVCYFLFLTLKNI